ncbi:MAG: hypothetical protein QMD77_01150 [Patescibacteria group bacterium]|nr:hypothetical protein [Patescibacteria group bacterium]
MKETLRRIAYWCLSIILFILAIALIGLTVVVFVALGLDMFYYHYPTHEGATICAIFCAFFSFLFGTLFATAGVDAWNIANGKEWKYEDSAMACLPPI